MRIFKLLFIIFLMAPTLSGCFLNSKIDSLSGKVSESSSMDLVVTVVSLPSSITFLTSGVINLEAASPASTTISHLALTTSVGICEVTTNGCAADLASGASCPITLNFIGSGVSKSICEIQFSYQANGVAQSKTITIESPTVLPGVGSVEKVYPLNGSYWNDYVLNSNVSKDIWSQSDTTCDLTGIPTTARNNYCLHGAENMKVYTGLDSCTGLTIQETLGAFDWRCVVRQGKAYFFTSSLKLGKGLRTLVDTSGWKQNRVRIYQSATLIVESPATTWWNNAVMEIPANAGSPGMPLPPDGNGKGIIYYLAVDKNIRPYMVGNKAAIVSLNGAKLIPLNSAQTDNTCGTSCLMAVLTKNYVWFETDIEYTASSIPNSAIYLSSSYFPRIINSKITSRPQTPQADSGIYATSADFGVARNVSISFFTNGINLNNFNDNWYVETAYLKSNYAGLLLGSFTFNSIFRNIFISSGSNGIDLGGFSDPLLQGVSTFNLEYGNKIASGTTYPKNLMSFLAVNSGYNNLNSGLNALGGNVTLTNIAVTNSEYALSFGTSAKKITGVLMVGSNTNNCESGNAAAGLVNSTCADALTDGTTSYTGSTSNAILRIGRNASSSFVGRVTIDDIKNPLDTNGFLSFASLTSAAADLFDNVGRAWGKEGSTLFEFPTVNGKPTSGNIRIYDWNLKATDTVFRNVSGDGATQNTPFVAGATCPSAVSGNKVSVSLETTPRTYLTNAWELQNDEVGDEDGLCESGERCLYAPNIGGYQGEGELSTEPCIFQNGTISSVKIYAYPTNGVP